MSTTYLFVSCSCQSGHCLYMLMLRLVVLVLIISQSVLSCSFTLIRLTIKREFPWRRQNQKKTWCIKIHISIQLFHWVKFSLWWIWFGRFWVKGRESYNVGTRLFYPASTAVRQAIKWAHDHLVSPQPAFK